MKPNISVQWVASMASVFWSVWWTTLVKDISESSVEYLPFFRVNIPKACVLSFLVVWGVIFAIVFVRWLYRAQYMDLNTGIGYWMNNSRSFFVVWAALMLLLFSVTKTFAVNENMILYGFGISFLWPFAPFIIAIMNDERR